MHPRQLPLKHRRIRLHQPLHTASPLRAGNRPDSCTLANQRVVTDLALHQQQVAAVLRQSQGVLGGIGQQQVNLAQAEQFVAEGQAQLQLQGDAAVGDFELLRALVR